jgi:tail tube protein
MSRFTRNTVMLSKAETTYGTDPVPTGAEAILMSNPAFKLVTQNVDRNLVRPYFGNSEQLAGTKWLEHGGDVELVGSGTVATAPAWDALILACAMAKSVEVATRVDYLPVTDGQASVTNYVYKSGVLHKALGARGKLTINMKQGEIPKLGFAFLGLYGGVSAASPSGIDFSAFQVPTVVNNTNSAKLWIGGAVADTGAPAVTGGIQYPSLGLELDLGLEVPLTALVGGETIDVTDRKLSGKVTLDLTAAQEVTQEASVLANTLQAVSFLHGTVAGKKVLVHAPLMQFTNPQYDDLNGRQLLTYDLIGVPDGDGNNELRIVLF